MNRGGRPTPALAQTTKERKPDSADIFFSQTNYGRILQPLREQYERKLNKDNDKLWNSCFLYIIITSSLFFIMMVRDIWKNYASYIIITTTTSSPNYNPRSAIVSFGSFQNFGDYKKNDDKESSVCYLHHQNDNVYLNKFVFLQ